jgi:hypothetical protein
MGAVFSQLQEDNNKWHPIAFYSKSMDDAQRNYDIWDKEMLAIIRALEEWRHYSDPQNVFYVLLFWMSSFIT